MAGGANRKFIADKTNFLKNNIIEVNVTVGQLIPVATAHVDPNKAVLAQRGRVANRHVAQGITNAAGIYDFDLIKSPKQAQRQTSTLGITHMTTVPVYELKEWGTKTRDQVITPNQGGQGFTVQYQPPPKANPITAYWVPWSSGNCWSVQLGNDADFFFTPTMDGCSLAISSGASPLVTHANYKRAHDPTKASQTRTVAEMTQHHTQTHNTDVARSLRKRQYAATHAEKTQGINKLVTVVGFRDPNANTWSFFWQRRRVNANNPMVGIILEDRLVPL